jgi:cardiolipin synthase
MHAEKKFFMFACALIVATVIAARMFVTQPATAGTPLVIPRVPMGPLIIEPADGIAPVLKAVSDASHTVDIVMYEFEDPKILHALADDTARGVHVRVLLNGGYDGVQENGINDAAYEFLSTHGAQVRWTSGRFALTHQKTVIVDKKTALILTFNFTPHFYATSRDLGITDTNARDLAAIETTFEADWDGKAIDAPGGNDLVWSPGSESEMLTLIRDAKKTLDIYNEEMADAPVTDALEAAARRGVNVRVDMTDSSAADAALRELAGAGVHVRTEGSSPESGLYIHAKIIIADGSVAFLGSENFSYTSLELNRELGLVFSDPAALAALTKTFESDWRVAAVFP